MPGVMIGLVRPGRASAGEGMKSGLDVKNLMSNTYAPKRDALMTPPDDIGLNGAAPLELDRAARLRVDASAHA